MIVAPYSKNQVTGTQADFDCDVVGCHLLQQIDCIIFIHHCSTVADALSVAAVDGFTDVKAQAIRRNQAHGQLTGVQGDVDLGIHPMQVVKHFHVQAEIVHGNVPVFRHHQVETNEAGIRRGKFEPKDNLREDRLFR